ncbi:MAG: four helix bundle protein [Candidatus Vogelbacteria bacterium]|nr:four helix bundle protein [Candidatus Vogelbacteria bacterium]
MNDLDIPIFKKSYDLYKEFYGLRLSVPKQDRYTIWQKCENLLIDVLEGLLLASQQSQSEKLPALERVSLRLNCLRVFVRLMKDVRALDSNKYILIETNIDDIGRQLGGWVKSTKDR